MAVRAPAQRTDERVAGVGQIGPSHRGHRRRHLLLVEPGEGQAERGTTVAPKVGEQLGER